MEGDALDPKRGVTILKTEYAVDYWARRQKLIAQASYIALKTKQLVLTRAPPQTSCRKR